MTTDDLKIKKSYLSCAEAARETKTSKRPSVPRASHAESPTVCNASQFNGTLFDLPHLMWATDLSGRCIHVNQMFEGFTGADVSEFTSASWTNFLHPDDVAATTEGWLHSVRYTTAHKTQYRVRRDDGTYVWMLARAVLVRDAAGRASHWVGTNTNVYELYQLISTAHEHRSIKQNFVRGLAHDLRTPLELIQATAESVLSDSDDPRSVERSLRKILKQVDRLDTMVEDLLYEGPA